MKTDPRKNLEAYARYSGIAIQMLVIIAGGTFGGYLLDLKLSVKPLFTVILSLSAVVIAIYFVTRDLLRRR